MFSTTSTPRASRVLFQLLRYTLRPWLFRRFRVVLTGETHLRRLRPPFVVVSNHVNFWDPFLLAMVFTHPLHFVAADGNFRSRVMRRLMSTAGAVPKAKVRTDMDSIHTLRRLVTGGYAVALFPEGQRTWDGVSRPLLPGTEKLVRLLGVPVLAVRLKGAYLSLPRWASRMRRGRLEIELSTIATGESVRLLPRHDLAHRLQKAIRFDEGRWQSAHAVPFVARRRAENAEAVLFWCPRCRQWDTLRSRDNLVVCTGCSHSAWFGPSGRLYPDGGAAPLYLQSWNREQLRRLTTALHCVPGDATARPSAAPALPCRFDGILLATGYRTRPLRKHGPVSGSLTAEVLQLSGFSPIPVSSISGINVQYANQLEFYSRGKLFVLVFPRRRATESPAPSAYRMEQTLYALQNNAYL